MGGLTAVNVAVALGRRLQRFPKMPTKTEIDNLIKTKQALAEKYHRLARLAKSKSKRLTLFRHAQDYRRQAENLSRQR